MTERLRQAVNEADEGNGFKASWALFEEPLTPEEVQAAVSYVQRHPNASSFVLLMAVRQYGPQDYGRISKDIRARVICDGMAKLVFLNDFGNMTPSNSHDGEAAKALLSVGRPALPYLGRLLWDTFDAPLYGSATASVAHIYKYRRCDWAYRYTMLILGREPVFLETPEERDKLIDKLKAELREMPREAFDEP